MDAYLYPDESVFRISRRALLANCAAVRQIAGSANRLRVVLLDDACGHGAAIVAETFSYYRNENWLGPCVDELAVSSLEEAYAVGQVPIPICVLGPIKGIHVRGRRGMVELAIERGWTLTIDDRPTANAINRIAADVGRPARVEWLAKPEKSLESDAAIVGCALISKNLESVRLTGIRVEAEKAECDFASLEMALPQAQSTWMCGKTTVGNAANSEILIYTPLPVDICPYGLSLEPTDTCTESAFVPTPVIRWITRLVAVYNIGAGDVLRSGSKLRVRRPMRVGVLPVGQSAGYPLESIGRAVVMVGGIACRTIGRTEAATMYIDLSNCPSAREGDEVVLIDNIAGSPATADTLAGLVDSTPNEIVTSVGKRVRRLAIEDAVRQETVD